MPVGPFKWLFYLLPSGPVTPPTWATLTLPCSVFCSVLTGVVTQGVEEGGRDGKIRKETDLWECKDLGKRDASSLLTP